MKALNEQGPKSTIMLEMFKNAIEITKVSERSQQINRRFCMDVYVVAPRKSWTVDLLHGTKQSDLVLQQI
jgi:hypothetical protein